MKWKPKIVQDGLDGGAEEEDRLKGGSGGYQPASSKDSDDETSEVAPHSYGGLSATLRRLFNQTRGHIAKGDIPFGGIFAIPLRIISPFLEMTADNGSVTDDKRVVTFNAGVLTNEEVNQLTLASSIIATCFGAIHILAWNGPVPSPTQLLLWRISSLTITCVPLLGGVAFKVYSEMYGTGEGGSVWLEMASLWPSIMAALAYITARIILIILTFMSLRSLPPGVYETVVWTTLIPHIY
ncbi:hypothetical protein JAAARDRAFT_212209 [Jaapia argillacea MUCL 33604]|uniref:Uncharacterized protein n=1 Tax=Jaapia argillacea MUCL 33604 TaxID=933084 RepID=A0A067P6T4_9AGAM|nr:hypothetical protein JAAARDRAFT_212209 [Jaapia argillacea MUCL 33604]